MAEQVRKIWFGPAAMMTALGDREQTLEALSAGICGLRPSPELGMLAGSVDRSAVAEIPGFTFFERLVIRGMEKVLQESGLDPKDPDLAVILSTTKGNVDLLQDSVEELPDNLFLYGAAEKIAAHFGFPRRPAVISNACISGVSALVIGREMLLQGKCAHVLVVGCDVLSPFIASGFASFKSVSAAPCRPYDAGRDGLTLGEACGAVLLTTDSGLAAQPHVFLAGGAITNDANHISGPSRTGDGLFYAMDQALAEAGLRPQDVGFVNAHGTATAYNDEMESKAVALAGLSGTPLNSVKGYIGHTLGASGVVETIICLEELRERRIYGTLGYSAPGTPCPLQVSSGPQAFIRQNCVKTASGFGGCNAAVVLSMETAGTAPVEVPGEIRVESSYALGRSDLPFAEFIRGEYRRIGEHNMKFFKMSDLCKAVYVSVMRLLEGHWEQQPEHRDVAVVLANRSSSLEADIAHQRILNEHLETGASPAVFVYTLPNVAIGEVCIRFRIKGNNTFFVSGGPCGMEEAYARCLLRSGKARKAICGWCEKLGENWNVELKLLSL